MQTFNADIAIIGAGGAGLRAAIAAAEANPNLNIALISKVYPMRSHTVAAEGGSAAVTQDHDSFDFHFQDTVSGGDWLCEQDVVDHFVHQCPTEMAQLELWGCPWSRKDDGSVNVRRFGGMKIERTWFAADKTGFHMLHTLFQTSLKYPQIKRFDEHFVLDILVDEGQVRGVVAINMMEGTRVQIRANAVVMATGGAGRVYRYNTNGGIVTGDGMGMAFRHGIPLRDMEFVQFHPTAMAVGADPMPLATEALRGEGAKLFNDRGERFMLEVPGQELAPRDVVARAIFAEIAAGRHVVLDARLKDIERRFPGVVALCRANGLDPALQPIPVRPAAHYHMGGIRVDELGRTSLEGLWACGEVASSGLHGANRLASNSLLEALAYAEWIAADIAGQDRRAGSPRAMIAGIRNSAARAEIRALMDRRVGVVRDAYELEGAVRRLDALASEGTDDLALVALMIASSALQREESRGGHFRADYPLTAANAAHSETTLDQALRFAEELREAPIVRRVA